MKSKEGSLITRKIKYSFSSEEEKKAFLDIQRQYSNLLHFTYNRVFENPKITTKELTSLQKTLKNVRLNSHLMNSAIFEAKALIEKDNKKQIIFGGRKLFLDRIKGNISKDEFKLKKLSPVYSVGESIRNGNRLFSILNETIMLFKPSRDNHFILNLATSRKGKKELLKLQGIMADKIMPVTIKMDSEYVYITFDYSIYKGNNPFQFRKIRDRIFSIDMNPNYIGWSVIDWKDENTYKIIDKGVISLKPLNDIYFKLKKDKIPSTDDRRIYINNKRKFEVFKVGSMLADFARHYQCSIFAVENLSIKSSDKGKGRKFNSLCNNLWNREVLYNQIKKHCRLFQIELLEVIPSFSSFIGNLVYRGERLPDMVLSSIEISRRGYEFYHQYVIKDFPTRKNIILPDLELVKLRVAQSLEELGCSVQFGNLKELYYVLKKSKQKYRFSLEEVSKFSSKFVKGLRKTYTVFYRFL